MVFETRNVFWELRWFGVKSTISDDPVVGRLIEASYDRSAKQVVTGIAYICRPWWNVRGWYVPTRYSYPFPSDLIKTNHDRKTLKVRIWMTSIRWERRQRFRRGHSGPRMDHWIVVGEKTLFLQQHHNLLQD